MSKFLVAIRMSKTVLITGASSGIGEATAKYFLQKGWNVAATMRSPVDVGDWANVANVICPRLDVTLPETIETAVRETVARFGRIDVLINNAGYALMGPLEGIASEQLQRQFQTNVFGLVSTIQTVLPILRQQRGGVIINVASIGGRLAFPLASSYHASKWAVEGLSEALRYELDRFNIKVKIIEPGGIRTNFINRGADWVSHPLYADLVDRVKQFSERLNDSLPEPEGVAKTIYRAATDRSHRLRYSPYGEVYLLLHSILPDRLWRRLVARMMFASKT
jgi:NAD(P)-dependent dehydrogenase (short-subunit alcohol dehydrogenase family)